MTEPRSAPRFVLLLACALACATAGAQPAPQPSSVASAAERAQQETDRTMYWIRVLASKPAPVKAVPAPRPVAAVAVATPSTRAVAEVREKARPAAAPATTTVAAATSPASDGAVAAPVALPSAPEPVPQPAAETLEPSALSSGTADSAAAETPPASTPDAEPDPGLVQVKSVQPDFPASVVRRVHRGNVEVKFEVDPEGDVVDATVVDSSHPRLNDAAVDAIKQWRFKPTSRTHTAMVNLVFDIDKEN
jgi:protein TonB